MSEPILSIRNMHKWFPGVHALNNAQLELYPGEVHALVGENGAGKSTLIKIIAGVHDFTEGEYFYQGKPTDITTPLQAIEQGIAVIYQELNLVEDISIAENIFIGQLPKTKRGRVLWKELYDKTRAILAELELNVEPQTRVQYLSTAQKQLVEIGKALSHNAKVVIMDEPTSALTPKEIASLFKIIRTLKERGVAIVYISHKMDEIFNITDRVTIYRDGQYVCSDLTKNFTEQSIIAAMVGRELHEMYPKTPTEVGDVVLDVQGLCADRIKDITFNIRAGEIVGFSGLMGAGRSEVAKAIFGVNPRTAGSIKVNGKEVPVNNPAAAKDMGIGFMSEDRKLEGNLGNMSVADNITIASLAHFSKNGHMLRSMEEKGVDQQIKALNIKTPSPKQLIVKLSGGNQQKVLLARWLIKEDLKVLIIDEPTRGIDVGAKAEIYSIIDALTKRGLAVCMMSSELPELLGMCDRIYVMRGGRITNEFSRSEATQELLMKSAIN
ncbi:MAG: sugar ABC transporter ATP-binding protein [Clostridiales bacterium]|nr:sugar ABC transporter ATP-binding protein [Clostridiales bacterium]